MPLPEVIPQLPGPQLTTIVKAEAADLETYLAGLPPDAWERPSGAPGWSIAEVVAHLAMGADFYYTYISRGLTGEVSPPPGFLEPTKAYLDPSFSSSIAYRTQEYRKSLGSDVLPALRARCQRLHHLLDSLTSDEWSRPAYHRLGVTTARGIASYRIGEVCLHTWDLKAGLEPAPSLHPRTLVPLVERAVGWLEWGFHPQPALTQPLRYRFQLAEPVPGQWDVVALGDRFEVGPATSEQSAVSFHCDPEMAILVFTGRIPWQKAQDTGRLTIEGEPAHVTTFFDFFRSV